MDFVDFLTNPFFLAVLCFFAAGMVIILMWPKNGARAIGFERVKPGFVNLEKGTITKSKEKDYSLKLSGGRKFVLPKEKKAEGEIVQIKKAFKLSKGIWTLFPIEQGQLTSFSDELSQQTNPLLDNESVSAVQNRTSLSILARAAGALGGGYTMILLAGVAAFAVGYITYPMFNHPPAIIECFTRMPNGTRIFTGYC